MLSNMSPVSASFIIQHITYQIFLLLLALRPCCQPSVSGEKRHKARFISPQLPFTALFSSLILSPPLALFLCFSPMERGRCLKNSQFFSFLLSFFAFFSSRMKTLHEAVQKQLCWRHTKTTLRATRQDRTTSLPLYSTELSTCRGRIVSRRSLMPEYDECL